jgi:hypothetical protein
VAVRKKRKKRRKILKKLRRKTGEVVGKGHFRILLACSHRLGTEPT